MLLVHITLSVTWLILHWLARAQVLCRSHPASHKHSLQGPALCKIVRARIVNKFCPDHIGSYNNGCKRFLSCSMQDSHDKDCEQTLSKLCWQSHQGLWIISLLLYTRWSWQGLWTNSVQIMLAVTPRIVNNFSPALCKTVITRIVNKLCPDYAGSHIKGCK